MTKINESSMIQGVGKAKVKVIYFSYLWSNGQSKPPAFSDGKRYNSLQNQCCKHIEPNYQSVAIFR